MVGSVNNYFNIYYKGDTRHGNLEVYVEVLRKGEINDDCKAHVLSYHEFEYLNQIEETLRQNDFKNIEFGLLLKKSKDINTYYQKYRNNEPLEEVVEYMRQIYKALGNKFSINELHVGFG